jgi:thiamine-phosphate diphosphorylase / hydroxyethylthiazole kinase
VVWHGSERVDGVAVVSAIIASADPEVAARELRSLVKLPPEFDKRLMEKIAGVVKAVIEKKPLSHNMTNLVVQNFAANVALCVGASPIMANYGEEAPDLAKHGGGLVINMGTVTPEGLENYLKALKAYNAVNGPVVFDPVG